MIKNKPRRRGLRDITNTHDTTNNSKGKALTAAKKTSYSIAKKPKLESQSTWTSSATSAASAESIKDVPHRSSSSNRNEELIKSTHRIVSPMEELRITWVDIDQVISVPLYQISTQHLAPLPTVAPPPPG